MSLAPSPGLRPGGQECLPPEIEQLLVDVVADGFAVYCCGPRAAPLALVAAYQWEDFVDLATIRCFDRVTTARVPAPQRRRIDVFAPETVVWAYQGSPQRALRALLDLVHPQHPDAPASTYPAPPALRIPRAEQRPMTIRLPARGRAGTRATRLSEAVDLALRRLVGPQLSPEFLASLEGIGWEGDLDTMRRSDVPQL
ncbi:MAG: hypothetical protein ACRDRR_17475 [Pseudonocardiaceae bacterium]